MSVTAATGFTAAGVSCGIKASGRKDIAVLACPGGAAAAGVFTTNKIVSPAVLRAMEHVKSGKVYGLVINSGNANACTGRQGEKDALAMCRRLARHIGCEPQGVLVASTGVIGHTLDMPKVNKGIDAAWAGLSCSKTAGDNFAKAIMTTDTRAKQAHRKLALAGREITIGGTAKGAGMIGPNMATTISVVTTDAPIGKTALRKALCRAVGQSLNKLTVDGHQSTNDTAFLLASGSAAGPRIPATGKDYEAFAAAMQEVYSDLARQMALDAEGVKKIFKVVVNRAASAKDAARAARAVADYDLVKCAVHGSDPNWGRIICAVGSCGVKLDASKLACKIGDVTVLRSGRPVKFDTEKASRIMSQPEHTITVDLAAGKYCDFCIGCELTRGYVRINADYHT